MRDGTGKMGGFVRFCCIFCEVCLHQLIVYCFVQASSHLVGFWCVAELLEGRVSLGCSRLDQTRAILSSSKMNTNGILVSLIWENIFF